MSNHFGYSSPMSHKTIHTGRPKGKLPPIAVTWEPDKPMPEDAERLAEAFRMLLRSRPKHCAENRAEEPDEQQQQLPY